jgi:hypothetical protein
MKNENDALKALGRRGQHSHEISRAPNPIIWRGRVDAQIHAVTAQDFLDADGDAHYRHL